MRKAFNFYKSFYDVYKELSKEDRVQFMDALLLRQFEGIEPKKLKGMANFAYKSQEQVINQQIDGWEKKTGLSLQSEACEGGSIRGAEHPTAQEKGEEKGEGQEKEEVKGLVREVVNYLNTKANKAYKDNTDKTITVITARRNEGFILQDFKDVIDIKVKEWINDEEMSKFIRPETLFGNKFESYLNQKPANQKPKRSPEMQAAFDRAEQAKRDLPNYVGNA